MASARAFGRGLVLTLLLLATGCATSADPHEGGFFSGVNGITSGGYEDRQHEQAAELARMQQQQRDAEVRRDAARAAVADRAARVVALRSDLAALDAAIAQQQNLIARHKAGSAEAAAANRKKAADLAAMKQRVATLRSSASPTADPGDYEKIRQEYLSVRQALATVRGVDAPREQPR